MLRTSLKAFEWLVALQAFNVNGLTLMTAQVPDLNVTSAGFANWGDSSDALRFVCVNSGSGSLVCTPEASYDGILPEQGNFAPVAFTVNSGYSYGDPYGVDEMRPWWRFWLNGISSGQWGVLRLRRY